MTTNHIAAIERVQGMLAQPNASLAELSEGKIALLQIIAAGSCDLEELSSRRTIEMSSASPAGELDKKLDVIDKREKEIVRRVEIAKTVLSGLEDRITEAREAERSAQRQARYDQALKLHAEATTLIRNFLENVAPASSAALQAYRESEAATSEANRDLPPGCLPIMSIEGERMGELPPPKMIARKYQVFLDGREPIGEVGKCEAHSVSGLWAVYLPSRSVQGDRVVPNCAVEDMVEITTQDYERRPLESLATSLRVPPFSAPAPKLGRPERKTMRLAEWVSSNGEALPVHAVAAE